MSTLRKFIRHAEQYGTEEIWEVASGDLTTDELTTLSIRLSHLDPKWRIPGPGRTNESGTANPHSNAEKCHAKPDSDIPVPPATYRDKWALCGECRERFEAARSTARYCSDKCRQRARRRRT